MSRRIRRRQLRSTFVWALCLATLVLVASFATALLQETPDYVIATLVVCAFVAAAVGVYLNLRVNSAHSEAVRDPLTGLPNRVLLDDRIEQAFRRSRRSGEPFTLIAIDLDGRPVDLEGPAQRVAQTPDERARTVVCAGSDREHDELVATDARDGVRLAENRLETAREGLQHEVACAMTAHVVDLLEAVEIDRDEREGLARPA